MQKLGVVACEFFFQQRSKHPSKFQSIEITMNTSKCKYGDGKCETKQRCNLCTHCQWWIVRDISAMHKYRIDANWELKRSK